VDLGDPAEFRKRVLKMLEQMEEGARKAGAATTSIEEARFALVAMLDEVILNSPWKGKDTWRVNPLQLELFKINVAGEEFFKRLERLRANFAENRDVLEVYYDCLALGFEGRYKIFGREKLEVVIAELSRELAHGKGWSADGLSPHGKRPDDFSEAVGEGVPIWATAAFFLPGVFILILLFALSAQGAAGKVADSIRQLLAGMGR
jgi:type VI secretion system protein ImpK